MSLPVYGIIALILLVFVVGFVFKVFAKVLKIFLTLGFLLLLLGVVLGFLAFQDAQEFDEKFADSMNLYLFKENNEFSFGFKALGFGINEQEELTKRELADAHEEYNNGNLEKILGENFRLFIFKEEFVKQLQSNDKAADYESAISEQGPALLFGEFQKGNVIVFPETPLFKAMKFIPEFVAENMRMFEETE